MAERNFELHPTRGSESRPLSTDSAFEWFIRNLTDAELSQFESVDYALVQRNTTFEYNGTHYSARAEIMKEGARFQITVLITLNSKDSSKDITHSASCNSRTEIPITLQQVLDTALTQL